MKYAEKNSTPLPPSIQNSRSRQPVKLELWAGWSLAERLTGFVELFKMRPPKNRGDSPDGGPTIPKPVAAALPHPWSSGHGAAQERAVQSSHRLSAMIGTQSHYRQRRRPVNTLYKKITLQVLDFRTLQLGRAAQFIARRVSVPAAPTPTPKMTYTTPGACGFGRDGL